MKISKVFSDWKWWEDEYGVQFYDEDEVQTIKSAQVIDGFYINDGKLFRYEGNDEDVVIPDCVVTICRAAFMGNTFKSVKLNEGLQKIESNAFVDCKIDKLIIPESVSEIENYAFAVSEIKKFESDSAKFVIENNGLYELRSDEKRLIRYIGDVWVPHEIKCFEDWDSAAFINVKMPEHFIVPKNVYLNYMTFVGMSGIETVELTNTYLKVNTDKLSSFGMADRIIFRDGITDIGNLPSYFCKGPCIYYLHKQIRNTRIKNPRKLGLGQFSGNKFKFKSVEITVPDSVKYIAGVHRDCTIICHKDSFAYNYAVKHKIKTEILK